MAERTFNIIDTATGKKVGEQTVSESFAPHLLAGQRAEPVKPMKAPEPEPAEDKPAKPKAADKAD